MNALEKYPLPKEESDRLLKLILLSELIWVAGGFALAIALSCVRHGGFLEGIAPAVWLGDLASTLFPHWTMLVLPLISLALVEGLQLWRMPRSEKVRRAIVEVRQGLTGEMPRLPATPLLPLMLLTGFAEELVFRYGLQGLLALLLAAMLPGGWAVAPAVLVASIVFTAVHTQYKDPLLIGAVFAMSLMLGAAYALTGSLLAVAVAHAAYDFCLLLVERWNMVREPDYFDGKVPVDELGKL